MGETCSRETHAAVCVLMGAYLAWPRVSPESGGASCQNQKTVPVVFSLFIASTSIQRERERERKKKERKNERKTERQNDRKTERKKQRKRKKERERERERELDAMGRACLKPMNDSMSIAGDGCMP